MSAEARQSGEGSTEQQETGDDVYVGERVFQQVLDTVGQDDAEAAVAVDYDDDGELRQYGIGLGGRFGRGVYLARKQAAGEEAQFNVYQVGRKDNPAIDLAERLWNDDSGWQYAIRRTEATFDRDLLTVDIGGAPEEAPIAGEVLPLFHRVGRAFNDDEGVVYTLTEDEGDSLSELEP